MLDLQDFPVDEVAREPALQELMLTKLNRIHRR